MPVADHDHTVVVLLYPIGDLRQVVATLHAADSAHPREEPLRARVVSHPVHGRDGMGKGLIAFWRR
jgi:hypothetical protein